MSEHVKVALIGCGAVMEMFYSPCIAEMKDIEVQSLFDPEIRRLEALRRRFPRAEIARDLASVISMKPQLAIVGSPPRFHAEQSIELSNAAIAVLCEKPMASTAEEGYRMIGAAKKAGRSLGVGLFRRFIPVNETIHKLVRDRELGSPRKFEIYEGAEFNWPAQSRSFFSKSGSSGGVLADVGIHILDLLVWWFGLPNAIVYEDDAAGGLEANCTIELGFAGGLQGRIRLSRDTRLPNCTVIECERGWLRTDAGTPEEISIGFWASKSAISGRTTEIERPSVGPVREHVKSAFHYAFSQQLRNAVDATRAGTSMRVTGEEAILSLQLVEECYRRRRLMQMPWLSDEERKAASEIAKG